MPNVQLRIDQQAIDAAKARFPEQQHRSSKEFVEWALWFLASNDWSISGVPAYQTPQLSASRETVGSIVEKSTKPEIAETSTYLAPGKSIETVEDLSIADIDF